MKQPKEYEIVTVADFAKVPPKRLRACLKEFAVAVEMARATEKLLHAVEEAMQPPGAEPVTSTIAWPMKAFRWTDDTEKIATLRIQVKS